MKGQLDLRQFDFRKPDDSPTGRSGDKAASLHRDERSRKLRIRSAIAGIENLPTLPNVVHEVIRLTNDPDTRAADFVSLFGNEQTLTARMLRIANSAFYGMNGKINTISKAVVILGYKTLKSIVLASSSTVLFKHASEAYGFAENGLWLHSVSVAHLVSHLARNWTGFSIDVADEMFVVGLMHDIGKVLLCQELEKYRTECIAYIRGRNPKNVSEMEKAIVGIDHCELGEIIIRKWKIGNEIADAIAHHHDTPTVSGENARYQATLVLADLLCNESGIGLADNCRWVRPISENLLASAQLDESSLDAIREEAKIIFAESAELIDTIA